MSTKIYYAWKIPVNQLNKFIDIVRPQIFNKAVELVKIIMCSEYVLPTDIAEDLKKGIPEKAARFRKAIKVIEEVSKKDTRSPGQDIDFALNIWLRGKYAYIIPVGEEYFKSILKLPKWAKDFSYWNNTDKPDNVSSKKWRLRSHTWNEVCLLNHNTRRLCHSIIDFSKSHGDYDAMYVIRGKICETKDWVIM